MLGMFLQPWPRLQWLCSPWRVLPRAEACAERPLPGPVFLTQGESEEGPLCTCYT